MYRIIDMNDWYRSGGGAQGDSYYSKTDDSVMLKVFKYQTPDQVQAIIDQTQTAIDIGIKTPKVYELVQVDDSYGIIFERIENKVSLFRAVKNDPSKAEWSAKQMAKMLKEIHSLEADKSKLVPRNSYLRYCYKSLLTRYTDVSEEEKTEFLNYIYSKMDELKLDESCTTCLMGDCHPGNIIGADGELYLIDLSLNYGDPIYDLGYVYEYMHTDDAAVHHSENKSLDMESKMRFIDALIKEYYSGCSDEFIEEQVKKMKAFPTLTLLMSMFTHKPFEELKKLI